MVDLHPRCKYCNSLMIITGEENGYRVWDCPYKCKNSMEIEVEELEMF